MSVAARGFFPPFFPFGCALRLFRGAGVKHFSVVGLAPRLPFWGLVFVAWENSDRHDRLPSDWAKRRRVVLERCGYRCEWDLGGGVRCGERATDVDHIRRGDDHSFANLRGLCSAHHARKSAGEGWAERQRLLKVSRGKFRRVEVHPAFL